MNQLPSNKYPNNYRVVSGTVNVYDEDVVLAVDTSTTACTINLKEIPDNYWQTPYKLYIYDNSGNAATNNITINAGSGQTINGASTLVLSTNGIRTTISISSNNSYLATRSDVTGGGITQAYTTVQDEGTSLPQRSVLNFVGANVTVTDSGGVTVVTISGSGYNTVENQGTALPQRSIINFVGAGVSSVDALTKTIVTINGTAVTSVTNSNILLLMSNSTLTAGGLYLITDGGNSNGGVLVMADSTNRINMYGSAFFLNADYQAVGNYSGVASAGTPKGIWSTDSESVSTNDFVVYNNSNYKNLTGSWGTAPSSDTTNWSILSKSITNGYILECDLVKYNVVTNKIEYRADKRGNEVDNYELGTYNPILTFQWGRDLCTFNRIFGSSSFFASNTYVTLNSNFILNGLFTDTTPKLEAGSFSQNIVSDFADFNCVQNRGTITNNTFTNACNFDITVILDISNTISYNNFDGCTVSLATLFSGHNITYNQINTGGQFLITGTSNTSTFTKNIITTNGVLTLTSPNGASFTGCQVSDNNTVSLGAATATYTYKKIYSGFSNWESSLDFSSGSVYDLVTDTLTIPVAESYVGIFTTLNSTGNNVTLIANSPTNHPFTIKPTNGQDFDFTHTNIGSAVSNCILLSNADPTSPSSVTGRTNGSDELVIKKYGTYNGIVNFNIWR